MLKQVRLSTCRRYLWQTVCETQTQMLEQHPDKEASCGRTYIIKRMLTSHWNNKILPSSQQLYNTMCYIGYTSKY